MTALSFTQIEQLQKFSDCIVLHPQIKTIFNDFDELRLNRNFQSDQQCMLLTGDTGVGKSHLINHYKKRTLASQNYGRESMPVLVSRISSGKGLDATLTQMLMDLELFGSHQRKSRGYATDLRKKLVDNLVKANVELIIINEFQELIEFKIIQKRQLIANALKYISEEAKVPIVLVGMPWAEQIAEEPQWSSRLVRRRKLEYFSLKNDRKYFQNYLNGLAKHMPFSEPPKLGSQQLSIPLFAASRGENRILKHLLLEALKIALSNDFDTLNREHFSEAYSQIFNIDVDDKNSLNPFKQPVNEIEISEVIKPSRYNSNAMSAEDMLIARVFSKPQTLAQLLSK
ncbi:TniB family NTP-binding protein [Shewanella morhuae]|uniref:TniB family NTP-binding protein n=1 Tax=Shewanella morhuae TaxID=365591 RepID=UPI001BB8AA8D|nr:TniB family NTP-binding protein [Shewanella morhuae]GIU01826.1 hypothetical protein TUM4641_00790 [Shewanella morhuae]